MFAFPFFWLVNTKASILICLAIVLGVNIGHDLMYGPQAAFFSELFGTRVDTDDAREQELIGERVTPELVPNETERRVPASLGRE